MTRILIVDDEEIERIALQKIIETEITEVEVIGQAENGRQAIEMAEQYQPDLILMDIKMPGIDGLGAIEAIQKNMIRSRLLLFLPTIHLTMLDKPCV